MEGLLRYDLDGHALLLERKVCRIVRRSDELGEDVGVTSSTSMGSSFAEVSFDIDGD